MKKEFKKQIFNLIKNEIEKNKQLIKTKINIDFIIQEILDDILDAERKEIRLLPYIDLSNTDFKDQNITHINFSNTNAKIDPQTIKEKDLTYTILNGLDFKDCSWDNASVWGANFTGAKNININPEKLKHKSLYRTILYGIDFKGKTFEKVNIKYANFIGAKNVKINLGNIWNKDYEDTIFDVSAEIVDEDVELQIIEQETEKIKKKIIENFKKNAK